MKIDKTFKIKEKYFNAILRLEKPFELRHEKVEPGRIIKLECENGRYLIFKTGSCLELHAYNGYYQYNVQAYLPYSKYFVHSKKYITTKNVEYHFNKSHAHMEFYNSYNCKEENAILFFNWYDKFCWEYINKASTYLIEIAEILEVK